MPWALHAGAGAAETGRPTAVQNMTSMHSPRSRETKCAGADIDAAEARCCGQRTQVCRCCETNRGRRAGLPPRQVPLGTMFCALDVSAPSAGPRPVERYVAHRANPNSGKTPRSGGHHATCRLDTMKKPPKRKASWGVRERETRLELATSTLARLRSTS